MGWGAVATLRGTNLSLLRGFHQLMVPDEQEVKLHQVTVIQWAGIHPHGMLSMLGDYFLREGLKKGGTSGFQDGTVLKCIPGPFFTNHTLG